MKAALHIDETNRLAALRGYGILDTPREADFDDVVKVASAVCEAPISVINIIDQGRQWFKAEVGLGVRETPLDSSICAHAILQPDLFIVKDTTLDNRFCDNALVLGDPRLRFYAGALLQTPEGLPLGTVCVLDVKPRDLNETQKSFLRLMASQVMKLLELRRAVALEHAEKIRYELLLRENETLMRESDHRVMNSLQLVQSAISLQGRNATSEEVRTNLRAARDRVAAIATVHTQLHLTGNLEEIEIDDFLRRLCENLKLTAPPNVFVEAHAESAKLRSDLASGLGLLVTELITNSFKYAFPDGKRGTVSVGFKLSAGGWTLEVADNGKGLPAGFDISRTGGVGMTVVAALVRRLNANLDVSSASGKTVFTVRVSH